MKPKIIALALLLAITWTGDLLAEPPIANATNQFAVTGMSCDGCANGITSELRRVKGVASASVSLTNKLAIVSYNTNQVDAAKLIQVVREAGYSARIIKP